jgi:hypothetical protein
MTLHQLVSDSLTPVNIISSSTGKVLKRNVTAKTLNRNPQLMDLHIQGVQSTFTTCGDPLTCWVDEQEFHTKNNTL